MKLQRQFFPLVAQNILASILAGLVLSNYFMNLDSYTVVIHFWISVDLVFYSFIEKCFYLIFRQPI
jgi:hypothetical protein